MSTYNYTTLAKSFNGTSTYDASQLGTPNVYINVPPPPFILPTSPSWYLFTIYNLDPKVTSGTNIFGAIIISINNGVLSFVQFINNKSFRAIGQVVNGQLTNVKVDGAGFSIPVGPFAFIFDTYNSGPAPVPRNLTGSYTQIL